MSEIKKSVSAKERDDFWDIDKLVPRRRASLSPFATEHPVRTYEPDVIEDVPVRSPDQRKITVMTESEETESTSYTPDGNSLIKRVTVSRIKDKYDFYDSFRRSALLYFDCKGTPCDFAQFYSYMPQYSHMSASQKSYYFFWREEMRRGRFIRTDYSYVYLYVYEILNLPDKIPPEEGIKQLCTVWREYRKVLPRIDLYFSIWVQDYCLVHGLSAPISELGEFIYDSISVSGFKEFYLSDVTSVGISGIGALLAYLSDYDWRRGKFASGNEGRTLSGAVVDDEAYKKHMQLAMYLLLSEVWERDVRDSAETAVISRNAFPNSLCTHAVKSRVEVEYVSLRASEELRRAVTAAVRYTENKLRALLGVKSRLAVVGLPDDYKRIIDTYFNGIFEKEQRRAREAARPAYEKLYEAPREALSFRGADEIERASWLTTARLVEGTEDEPQENEVGVALEEDEHARPERKEHGALSAETAYLAGALGVGIPDGADIASSVPEETLVERINEMFLDMIGDVVLADNGEGFEVIDDYREDVREWLLKQIG